VARQALQVSAVDFSITAGAGLCLVVAPYPVSASPAKFERIATAFKQAAQNQSVNLRWSGDFKCFADSGHIEIDEPTGGQWPASSPAAAPESVQSGSVAQGGPAYEKLIAWLKAEEGLVLKGHWDRIGKVWDIGYGYNLTAHGVPDHEARGLVWTPEQADKALRTEVAAAMVELESHWPRWDDEFDQVRQTVFVSGVYQLGVGGASTFHNTIACIRSHDFPGAVRNLHASKWARQTPARVGRIEQMLLTGEWPKSANGVTL